MEYAQTIAMARHLLADGRAEDVVGMIEPLLNTSDADAADEAGRALLHALMARVRVVHTGDVERALTLLAPFETPAARGTFANPVRAELTLWLGWAHARRDETLDEEARALHLLDEAQRLFADEFDGSGRCWALIGQAQAYFAIDEYQLMRQALEEATTLQHTVRDVQADRWIHDLSVPALRFQGRYAEAHTHVDALADWGERFTNREVEGRALAYRAALRLDQGHPPERIITTAERAEARLHSGPVGVGYPLLAAYHAHIRALMLRGAWEDAAAVIDTAVTDVSPHPTARAHLQTLRARLALRRDRPAEAEATMAQLFEEAHRLPHGLQRSHVALLRGELLNRAGDHDVAQQWMKRAYRNARETGHRGNQFLALLTLAEAALTCDDTNAAEAALHRIDRYEDYFSVLPFAARRFRVLGRHARLSGRPDAARSYFDQALSAYSLIGDASGTAEMQRALAELEVTPPTRARSLLESAATTFERLGAEDEAVATRSRLDRLPPPDGPAPSRFESTIAASLARAALSPRLVAEAWMQAVGELLPDRWIGIYRRNGDTNWTCVHEHGDPPPALSFPETPTTQQCMGGTRWVPLHAAGSSVFCMGIAPSRPEDPAWQAAASRLAPWRPVVQLALDRATPRQPLDGSLFANGSYDTGPGFSVDGFVYNSTALRTVAQKIERMRSSYSPGLISGEPGAGKTTVARAIHATSERREGPWHTIHCASVPPDPLEARLFGRPGSDPGLLQRADGGTLLLKEVGGLPAPLQTRLLRVLDDGKVASFDSDRAVPVDVRLLASTSEDLEEKVRTGAFRDDLYFRLNVISLPIPPLRERRDDIPVLVQHFLDRLRPAGMPPVYVTNRAFDALLRYHWPGNVQQLRNEIERALVLVGSEPAPTVDVDLLSESIQAEAPSPGSASRDRWSDILRPDRDLSDILARTEKKVIERVLAECGGQITSSSDVLGLSRQGLYKKMKRLGINATAFKRDTAPPPVAN